MKLNKILLLIIAHFKLYYKIDHSDYKQVLNQNAFVLRN